MNVQQQYVAAEYLASGLLVLGVFALGLGAGSYVGIAYLLNSGCSTDIIASPMPCQQAMRSLNTAVKASLVAGILSIASTGGIRYYLQRAVP